MSLSNISNYYPENTSQEEVNSAFQEKLKRRSKEFKIEFLEEIIYMKILNKEKLELFNIENFDQFEHVSELIEEEFEKLVKEDILLKKEFLEKFEKLNELKSIYSKYKWVVFPSSKYIFIVFALKSCCEFKIERNFIKLNDFMVSLKLEKHLQDKNNDLIKIHFQNLLIKSKAINKLEKNSELNIYVDENFEIGDENSLEHNFRKRKSTSSKLLIPLTESHITYYDSIIEKNFFTNKFFLLAFFLFFFIIFCWICFQYNDLTSTSTPKKITEDQILKSKNLLF